MFSEQLLPTHVAERGSSAIPCFRHLDFRACLSRRCFRRSSHRTQSHRSPASRLFASTPVTGARSRLPNADRALPDGPRNQREADGRGRGELSRRLAADYLSQQHLSRGYREGRKSTQSRLTPESSMGPHFADGLWTAFRLACRGRSHFRPTNDQISEERCRCQHQSSSLPYCSQL